MSFLLVAMGVRIGEGRTGEGFDGWVMMSTRELGRNGLKGVEDIADTSHQSPR